MDSRHLRDSIERAEFSLNVELWFGEKATETNMVSSRNLKLNFHPIKGLHYHLPVLFDYFHLASITMGIHASMIALHQPYIKWVSLVWYSRYTNFFLKIFFALILVHQKAQNRGRELVHLAAVVRSHQNQWNKFFLVLKWVVPLNVPVVRPLECQRLEKYAHCFANDCLFNSMFSSFHSYIWRYANCY